LTIFHGQAGQPLDFARNPDPYAVGDAPRQLVKAFITATFGKGQFPGWWPQKVASEHKEKTGHSLGRQYPICQVREAVAAA
jgi:hypothetical protein